MGKRSAGQIALDQIDAEIATLEQVRARLAEAISVKPARTRKPKASESLPLRSKRRDRGEGATTDSGNMDYPPA